MTVFGSFELVAGEEPAVEDQATAHAGADEETDDVLIAFGGAEVIFTQDAKVYIVADEEGNAEFLAHGGGDVVIAPGQVRREEHDSLILIDHAGGAGRHGVQFFLIDTGFLDHLVHDADDDLFHVGGAFAAALGTFFQAVDDLVLFVEDRAEHLGAAHVQTDVVTFSHSGTLLINSSFTIHHHIYGFQDLMSLRSRPNRPPLFSGTDLSFAPAERTTSGWGGCSDTFRLLK